MAAPPSAPVDPALPKDAIWVASMDLKRLIAALPNGDFSGMVEKLTGAKNVTVEDLGLDVTRPVTVAELGVTDAQRRAVAAVAARPVDPVDGNGEAVRRAAAGVSFDNAFRMVIPTTNAMKTKAAAELALAGAGAKDAGGDAYELAHGRVELRATNDVVVIDVGLGETPKLGLEALRARVAAGHADAPPLEGRAVRARYRPAGVAELGGLMNLFRGSSAMDTPNLSARDRDRMASEIVKEVKGATLAGSYDSVDLSARVESPQRISFEARGEPGPTSVVPPATAWAPSPSITAEGATGTIAVNVGFARAFVLGGEKPGDPLSRSPLIDPMKERPTFVLPAMLPEVVPLFVRLVARAQDGLAPGALERFERIGYLYRATGAPTFFALLPKTMRGEAAECALIGKPTCTAKERMKPGVPFDVGHNMFAQLVSVKGSTAQCVLIGEDKEALKALRLLSGTAQPFELSLARHVSFGSEGFDFPGLAGDARVTGGMAMDGKTVVLRIGTP